jgi:hypothetical protein
MPARHPLRRHLVAQLAALKRHHPDALDAIAAIERALVCARAEEELRRAVASARTLDFDARARLAATLLAGGGEAA